MGSLKPGVRGAKFAAPENQNSPDKTNDRKDSAKADDP